MVTFLQICRDCGKNVYVVFNTIKLYSCDVTNDGAHIQLNGITEDEEEKINKEFKDAKTIEEREAVYKRAEIIQENHANEMKKKAVQVDVPNEVKTTDDAIEYLKKCRRERRKCIYRF